MRRYAAIVQTHRTPVAASTWTASQRCQQSGQDIPNALVRAIRVDHNAPAGAAVEVEVFSHNGVIQNWAFVATAGGKESMPDATAGLCVGPVLVHVQDDQAAIYKYTVSIDLEVVELWSGE